MSGQQLLGIRVNPSSPILPFIPTHTQKKKKKRTMKKLFSLENRILFLMHTLQELGSRGCNPSFPCRTLQHTEAAVGPSLATGAAPGVGAGHP